jgi:integrase
LAPVNFPEHLEALASTDDPNPYLTPSLSDKRSGGKTGLSSTFKQIMDKAGIDPEEIQGKGKRKFSQLSFHSLRHAFNSLLANQGVDQETRMKLTGQKSKAVNKDYTHLDMDKLSSAMQKLPMLELP